VEKKEKEIKKKTLTDKEKKKKTVLQAGNTTYEKSVSNGKKGWDSRKKRVADYSARERGKTLKKNEGSPPMPAQKGSGRPRGRHSKNGRKAAV